MGAGCQGCRHKPTVMSTQSCGWNRVAILAMLLALCEGTYAQKYPDRPIRLIAQSPAGGTADLIARVVAQKLGDVLGQSVVVDNRAGAAGVREHYDVGRMAEAAERAYESVRSAH